MIQNQPASRVTPLTGRRVLVTRAQSQAAEMSRLLRELGAEPIELPTIEIERNPYPDETRRALSNLHSYDWIVFTSTNAVSIFFELLAEHGLTIDQFNELRAAAVGSSTATLLRAQGVEPDVTPDEFHGDALLDEMRGQVERGTRVLLPRAEVARESLPDGLRDAGASVHVLPIYRTVAARPNPEILKRISSREIDVVSFTSSSAVNNFLAMLDDGDFLSRTRIACIGPVTAQTVRAHGLEPWIVASEHTIPGLVDAMCTALEAEK